VIFSLNTEKCFYVSLPVHEESGQARGLAFVGVISKDASETAIGALNGFEVGGRVIRVVESLPQDKAKVEPKKFGGC
jgi:RNA recognition motif-containing protein